ncbi:MAG: hypothetical protein K9G62_02380 [Alphaproteobacteria bacterium]|nr:hypothetical protein [Alphaproteobacteria bacterium]
MKRREFLRNVSLAGLAYTLTPSFSSAAEPESPPDPPRAWAVFKLGKPDDPLLSRNLDTPVHPASLTKLATMMAYFHYKNAGMIEASDGQIKEIESDIKKALVSSDNNAAERVAEFLERQPFALKLIRENNLILERRFQVFSDLLLPPVLKEAGLKNTQIYNPTGFPWYYYENIGQPHGPENENMSTVRDLGHLCDHMIRNYPEIHKICGIAKYKGKDNSNWLLENSEDSHALPYEGTDCCKTGYIKSAGYCLALSAEQDGTRLIAITMGNQSLEKRRDHGRELLEQGFKVEGSKKPEESKNMAKTAGDRVVVLSPPDLLPQPSLEPILQTTRPPAPTIGL